MAGAAWDTLTVTGKITVPPDRLVRVGPRIEGKVVAVYANVGDFVHAGQSVAAISSVELAEARATYRQANARVAAARRNLDSEKRMVDMGAVSSRPVEEARSASLEAQQALTEAKSAVAEATSDRTQAEAEVTQCEARVERARDLYKDQIVSKQDLETAEGDLKRDQIAYDAAATRVTRAQDRVADAQAAADNAKAYLAREEKVGKSKILDSRAIQVAQTDLDAATIDAQAAAERIRVLGASPEGSGDTLSITSPIAGRVVARNTSRGEMASPSDALFTIANLSEVWIQADVFEKDIAKVRSAQTAEIRVDAYPDRVFRGRVEHIDEILSPESRTAKVRIAVANPDGDLKGEMFANVTIVIGGRGGAVLIPKEAVLDDSGKKTVFVVCEETAADRKAFAEGKPGFDKFEVETGSVHGNQIEIRKGLEPGARVVTTGQYQLLTAFGGGKLEAGCCAGE